MLYYYTFAELPTLAECLYRFGLSTVYSVHYRLFAKIWGSTSRFE